MFPFKEQLFQGCKSETEPTINTKSVVQHVIRYQVLLGAYYKYAFQIQKKTVSYMFSLFNDHQQVTGTDF
jgi:hypothetical protein